MTIAWTSEQILGLAPDTSSAKSGREMAKPAKWQTLGYNEALDAVWGECKGSAKEPYQTQIALKEPAFHCTCPSRKFPCKHGLGLFLMLANDTLTFEQNDAPAWVSEWLEKQAKKQEQKAKRVERAQEREGQPADTAAQAKRAQERQAKVEAGLGDLELWLRDLVRRGLTHEQIQSYNFWDGPAARLVDAQAPGLARRLRELGSEATAGQTGWQERVLEGLGRLYLLMEGYKRLATLPEGLQSDLRNLIGWNQNQDELLAQPGLKDSWLLLGQRTETEERLRTQRTWLVGRESGRYGLNLQFTMTHQRPEISLVVGCEIEAEAVFFPSAYPLRLLLKDRSGTPSGLTNWPGYAAISEGIAVYAQAITANPWLEEFPLALQAVYPRQTENGWQVRDAEGFYLPLSAQFEGGWRLLALSGGQPLGLFGEWNGRHFLPLSAWVENRFVDLSGDK